MFYYIIDNRIIVYQNEFDRRFYDYNRLNEEQVIFYLANPNASLSEILNCSLNVTISTLDDLKQVKINDLQNSFNTALSQGYTNQQAGITLALSPSDRSAFIELLTLTNLAKEFDVSADEQKITDINGVEYVMPVTTIKGILLQYGFYYNTLWSNLVSKKALVNNAGNEEELNNISW